LDEKALKLLEDMREFASHPNHEISFGYDGEYLFAKFVIGDKLVVPVEIVGDDFVESLQKLVEELPDLVDRAVELGLSHRST